MTGGQEITNPGNVGFFRQWFLCNTVEIIYMGSRRGEN